MFKNYLQAIDGVEVYAIISMLIFVLFFIAIIIWLIKVDKLYIKKMEELPLEKDDEINCGSRSEFQNLTGITNE